MPHIENGGVRTYYEEHGAGAPLVLVHGLGGSTELWRKVVDELARDFHVVLYDLRGAGRSDVPAGPYSLAALVDDLDHLIRALHLDRVLLVGHSLGGSVALRYAADHPDRVLAVVGVGALAELPEQGRDGMRARARTVEAGGMGAVAEGVAAAGTAPSFQQARPEELRELVTMLERSDPTGYAELCRVVADIDIVADLERVAAPVLLVAGDRDAVVPPEANERSAARLPAGTHVSVEDSAHVLIWDRPEALLEAAPDFLREAARRG